MKRSLKKRLDDLRRTGEVRTGRQLAEQVGNRERQNLFPGESREVNTAFGNCYVREIGFPLHHRHGKDSLAGILNCSSRALALPARDSRLESFNPESSLFLDIETTGLAGGTGTWAFLIGIGWLEEERFLVRQYFLRRPAEERAVLEHFSKTAGRFPALVTFNGKMFDLPLIQTRQTLAGFSLTDPPLHLDLLQCARSLWKKRFPSRSLRSLEESLLGLQRVGDIPGAEIPAVYMDYLRRGQTGRLKEVFKHNVLDILSMVTLLERISRLAAGDGIEHPGEALALGRLWLEAGRTKKGLGFLSRAAESRGPLALEAALELSFFYKRRGCWPEAVTIWQKAVEGKTGSPDAHVELAKYCEHRLRDYRKALEHTDRALDLVCTGFLPRSSGELSIDALGHRRRRLQSRLARDSKEIKPGSV